MTNMANLKDGTIWPLARRLVATWLVTSTLPLLKMLGIMSVMIGKISMMPMASLLIQKIKVL